MYLIIKTNVAYYKKHVLLTLLAHNHGKIITIVL